MQDSLFNLAVVVGLFSVMEIKHAFLDTIWLYSEVSGWLTYDNIFQKPVFSHHVQINLHHCSVCAYQTRKNPHDWMHGEPDNPI